jgi:hypothetical protein
LGILGVFGYTLASHIDYLEKSGKLNMLENLLDVKNPVIDKVIQNNGKSGNDNQEKIIRTSVSYMSDQQPYHSNFNSTLNTQDDTDDIGGEDDDCVYVADYY